MAKVNIEIDTQDVLEQIGVDDIVDALAYDIGKGDTGWWAERICSPVLEEVIKALNDKNSDLFKCIVAEVSERLADEIDIKPICNKIAEEKVLKLLKL